MHALDYDCVIFDLDHTLVRYNLQPLFELIYSGLQNFLVECRYFQAAVCSEILLCSNQRSKQFGEQSLFPAFYYPLIFDRIQL